MDMKKIIVGSTNPVKIEAVRETLSDYKDFKQYEVVGIKTDSEVSEQPKSLAEILRGAINRSKSCFDNNCIYGFGIESGLMEVPYTKTGYMDICASVIYDGNNHYSGLSSAFECPLDVIKKVNEEGLDLNESFHRLCLTNNPRIGLSEGAIGLLTNGRVTRKDYTKQAIQMALIQLENKELYQ